MTHGCQRAGKSNLLRKRVQDLRHASAWFMLAQRVEAASGCICTPRCCQCRRNLAEWIASEVSSIRSDAPRGGVPERFKGTVLKTVVAQATVGSNPTPSAII